MQFSKKMLVIAAIVPLVAGLGGCAGSKFIEVRQGSELVTVAEATQVGKCLSKGKVNVSVLSEVGFITRSAEAVEANLQQLARNGAIDNGGDTIVKGSSTEYGKRTFEVYKCRP